MREAVIVSYARTGLAKSGRGGFNITPPMSLAAHAVKHAVDRAGVDKEYVEDYLGNCAHGAPNIGRQRRCSLACRTTGGVSETASARRACRPSRWPPTRSAGRRRLHRGWRRRGIRSPAAARRGSIDQGTPESRARHLHGDDRHRRHRRGTLQGQPNRTSIRWNRSRMAAAQQANKFKDEIVPMKTK
jgi:acetyl-CoA C-acetyltransferase